MISIINAAGFVLGCYFLLKSVLLIREKKEEVQDFLIWGVVGVSLLVLSVAPQIGDTLADYLDIRTRTSTFFALAIFLLYLILFRMNTTNRNLDQQISKLNEEIAVLKLNLEEQYNKDKKRRKQQ